MANLILAKEQTVITFKSSGGSALWTLTSLANNAGRVSTQYDRGAAARPRLAIVRCITKLGATTTSIVAGNAISIYFATADTNDATQVDGNVGQVDAALSSIEKRRNLQFVGTLEQDKTVAAGDVYIGSWLMDIPWRYLSACMVNEIGQALSATATDHQLWITFVPDEVQ